MHTTATRTVRHTAENGSTATGNGVPQRDEAFVGRLLAAATHGLGTAYLPDQVGFAQTVRSVRTDTGMAPRPEGSSLRYAAIAALGLSRLPEDDQRQVLGGCRAADVVTRVARRALHCGDPGAVALAAWAVAEVNREHPARLLGRLDAWVWSGAPIPVVDLAWMVTAMTAVRLVGTGDTFDAAVHRLLAAQGRQGIFPHQLPATSQSSWRAHVGSFADQIYPVQALARGYRVTGDPALLEAANQTAQRLCVLQGRAGQWWWHYDTRNGQVVERFPVYAVHQHAMAPMVLFELAEAGGHDHRPELLAGLRWLQDPPETAEEMFAERYGLVWRKVGRREPRKAARVAAAVGTRTAPGRQLTVLDRLFPPGVVDHECRPYELGWLLYAWAARGAR